MGLLTSMNIDEDRKNLMNTIKWSLETFKDNKDVGIVIKTSIGKSTESDKLSCTQIIKNFIKEHRPGEFPKINLIHGNLTSKEIAALFHHNKIKMFISGTRGEGYGLPLADAAAAGIPIVVTGWSGCFDFLDKELVSPVKYNMVEVPKNKIDGEIFVENTKWANPDENDFKFKLNNVYKDYKAYKEKAKVLQKNIHHKINKNFIKKKYDEFLKEVLTIV
jgi:glycosyltransferase involved in cell wall biosynthesis